MAGCAQTIHNEPINQPLSANPSPAVEPAPSAATNASDDTVVAVTFSGGGTRAAAFSYGVLEGFDQTHVPSRAGSTSLLDHIDFVSGVSGGAVLAAYYGLRHRAALTDFRERFLLANAEEPLQTDLSFFNIAKGLAGGVNDPVAFPHWLDDHLFGGATYQALLTQDRPRVWINASDIYSRTTFIFSQVTFNALCSNLADYPISLAVAASAAVPVIFAPVVIQNYPGGCPNQLPAWVQHVHNERDAAPLIKSYADALERYHQGEIRYVKLLDGGLVDNYGLAGFTIARLASNSPYGPLAPQEAVKVKRLLFLVVDAGRDPSGAWAQTVAGPSGIDLITATSDTATGSGAVGSYSAFSDTMEDWKDQLVAWRCHLSAAERQKLGTPPGWNCKDVQFFITRVGFDQLGPQREAQLNAVETRLRLPPDQVDLTIAAGHDALLANDKFRAFLGTFARAPRPHVRPHATPPKGAPVASSQGPQEADASAR